MSLESRHTDCGIPFLVIQRTKKHTHTHTHNHFTALWILSGTTQVSQYQKKHSPTHLSWSSVVPNLLHPSSTIHGILPVQFTRLIAFFQNLYLLVFFGLPLGLAPSTSYISSPNHCSSFCNTCPYHCNLLL